MNQFYTTGISTKIIQFLFQVTNFLYFIGKYIQIHRFKESFSTTTLLESVHKTTYNTQKIVQFHFIIVRVNKFSISVKFLS